MKKTNIMLLAICISLSLVIGISTAKAEDFSKKEDYYIKLCSSSRLTTKNKKVCQEFNSYLKKKNANLKKDIKETQQDLKNTKND
ncbi:MAG: hypothetical protein K2P09_03690, partial [Erysipelotrichales bacterium]|nr:hypothetical protein [Erysipelotrichales bacterium]